MYFKKMCRSFIKTHQYCVDKVCFYFQIVNGIILIHDVFMFFLINKTMSSKFQLMLTTHAQNAISSNLLQKKNTGCIIYCEINKKTRPPLK